jgi:hypothetical protein
MPCILVGFVRKQGSVPTCASSVKLGMLGPKETN